MKNIWLIFCSAFALTLLTGCTSDEPVTPPEPEAPQLTLETTTLEVAAEGGSFDVTYELLNPIDGAELKVSVEQDWVYDVDTTVDGVISFKVDASYESSERKCRLEITYPQLYPNPTLTIHQAEGKEHSIAFRLTSVAATTITMDVIPKDKEMPYVFILGNGKYIEENGLMTDDEALWASDMDIFQSFADAFGGDIATAATAFMYQGDLLSHQFTGVTPNTTYVAYAYGFDTATLQPTTEISRIKITTSSVQDYILHFDFNVEVDGPNVTMDITPQGYDGYFFFGVFAAQDVPKGTPEEEFRGYCEASWEEYKALYSSFFDGVDEGLHFVFNELAYKGTAHLETDLDANTEYVLWAFGMDDEALLNTTPEYYYFTTGDVGASSNTFDISITELHPRKATVNVEVSNDDTYAAALLTADRLEGLSDSEAVQYIIDNFNVSLINGSMSDTATGLTPNTAYEVVVFGYEAGCATTAATRLTFTTPEAVIADLDFSLTIGKYYDGTAVAELNSAWKAAKGYVIVPIAATVDAAAVNYYYSVMYAADFPYYDYETLITGLLSEGPAEEGVAYVLEYDSEFSFFGVAEDANGDFTEMWSSKPMRFTPEGCSPAEEFLAEQNAAATSKCAPMSCTTTAKSLGLLTL